MWHRRLKKRGCQRRCRPRPLTSVQNYGVSTKIALLEFQNVTLMQLNLTVSAFFDPISSFIKLFNNYGVSQVSICLNAKEPGLFSTRNFRTLIHNESFNINIFIAFISRFIASLTHFFKVLYSGEMYLLDLVERRDCVIRLFSPRHIIYS